MFRNISVIGLGKLGYPMAQFLSSSGAKISCYDKDEKLVDDLKKNHGEHLHEIGLQNLVNNKNDLIYHQNISSNEIINSATFLSRAAGNAINYFITMIMAIILSTGIVTTILLINYKISFLIIFFATGSYFFIGLFVSERIKQNGKIQLTLSNKQIKIIQTSLNSIKDILLSSNQNFFLQRYKITDETLRRKFGETRFISLFPKIIIETFVLVFIAIIGYFIFRGGEKNLYLLPILGTILISLQKLFPFTQQIFSSWAAIKTSKDSIETVIKFMNLKPKNFFNKKDLVKIPFKKSIHLKNIYFKYPKSNKNIINDFSLEIRKGSRVGIKGTTGNGKSTLINILMGLIVPENGQLFIS